MIKKALSVAVLSFAAFGANQASGEFHADSDDRADDGRHQNHRNECFPAKPGTQRSKQFEISVAHSFFSGGKLE